MGSVVPLFEPDLRPPFHRSATVYLHNGRVFASPDARTRTGVGVIMEIVHEAASEDNVAVGEAILSALRDCVDNVSHDLVFAKKEAIFKATKLRSWTQLNKKAASASVLQNPDVSGVIRVSPMRRSGGPGSQPIEEKMESVKPDADSVGQAVLRALAASELAHG